MAPTAQNLQPILDKVYALEGKAIPVIDRPKLDSFLQAAINGDQLITHLVIPIKFGEKGGVGVYLLTNVRLIMIRISESGFESATNYLSEITSVIHKLGSEPDDKNNAQVRIETAQGFFGLHYPSSEKTIHDFFSQLEATVRQAKQTKAGA